MVYLFMITEQNFVKPATTPIARHLKPLIMTSIGPRSSIQIQMYQNKKTASVWMSKRIAFIRQLITERSISETDLSRPLKEEGDRLHSALMSQMNKVKKNL